MFGINRPGIWVAFGLSVVFHVAGFEFAKFLPRTAHLSSPLLLEPSIRLIQTSQQLLKNSAETAKPKLRSDDKAERVSVFPSAVLNQNKNATQVPEKPEEQNAGSTFLKSIHYFESSEVDKNSELLDEWVIRTQGVQSTAIVAIHLTLYINENGRLDKFVVLNSSLSEVETNVLLNDFALTAFKPALKDEKPVPSQKNVEILLDPNPVVFRLPNFLNNFLPANK
mgnify:CR=1 FL=1